MIFRVSQVANEATTADGQPLERGGEVELSPEQRDDPYNARLIAEGQLIAINQTNKAREDAEKVLASPPPIPVPPPAENPNENGGTS